MSDNQKGGSAALDKDDWEEEVESVGSSEEDQVTRKEREEEEKQKYGKEVRGVVYKGPFKVKFNVSYINREPRSKAPWKPLGDKWTDVFLFVYPDEKCFLAYKESKGRGNGKRYKFSMPRRTGLTEVLPTVSFPEINGRSNVVLIQGLVDPDDKVKAPKSLMIAFDENVQDKKEVLDAIKPWTIEVLDERIMVDEKKVPVAEKIL